MTHNSARSSRISRRNTVGKNSRKGKPGFFRKPKASPVKSVSLDLGNLHTTPVETLAVSGTQADIHAFMASGRAIEVPA